MTKVFLGGTCMDSTWRDELVKMLKIDYFNPVVEDWTPKCMQEEIKQRQLCDYCLYTINSEYPNPISRKEFILDYDCLTNEEIDISGITDKATEFNKIIHEWFEKSIQDGLRDIMGVVNND